ncbi:MAG: S-layer homology domain-containing protein [Synechococcales cyanobacterium C42_A2020_086]|jgi:hypothetical protein|nr:S-layer homology domain-containing protein [Synechococcales cyanobacterium C42_A2020_086]
MERFTGALSLTLLLMGVTAVAQIQPSQPLSWSTQVRVPSSRQQGTVAAEATLSRAELASILVHVLSLEPAMGEPASVTHAVRDVPPSHWAYHEIQTVLAAGIMKGDHRGRFFPDRLVTRAEAFSILAQVHSNVPIPEAWAMQVLSFYSDAAEIPPWARQPMATALQKGFVNVQTNRRVAPLTPMTHGDLAFALSRYLQRQQAGLRFPAVLRPLWQRSSAKISSEV